MFILANQVARVLTLSSHLECDTLVHPPIDSEIGISPSFREQGPLTTQATTLFVNHPSRKMRQWTRNGEVIATNSLSTKSLLVIVVIHTIGENFNHLHGNGGDKTLTSLHEGVRFIYTMTSSEIGSSAHERGVSPSKNRL